MAKFRDKGGEGFIIYGERLLERVENILRASDRILVVGDLQNISSLFSYNQHTYIHSIS